MINAIVVDNERASIEVVKFLLKDYPLIMIVETFQNPCEAKSYLECKSVDMVIADIEMPGLSGFDLVSNVANKDCSFIFMTAHDKYAVDAFEYNALDFLLKPISRERLAKAIGKVISRNMDKTVPQLIKAYCFDSFKICIGNTPMKFRTNKAQELIAFLIHKEGRIINRSEIIDNLWNDFEGDKAIVNFNTTLSYAKRAFTSSGIDFPIMYEKGCYGIDIQKIECDFTKLLNCEIKDVTYNEEIIKQYESILALYIGEYFAANDYQWALNQRLILRNKYVKLSLAASSYYSDVKNFDKALEYLTNAFSISPMDTELTSALIKTLYSLGNYSLALGYYKTHKDILYNELHIEPAASLKAFMGQ